jgi:Carboxypeptidase regulatory-like domain
MNILVCGRLATIGRLCILTLASIGWLALGTASAQVLYGSVVGNVRDTTGAALPGASVTLTNQDTNLSRETTTNEVGTYNFVNVLPGPYAIKVTLQGFREFRQSDVPVTVNTVSRIDVSLPVGQIAETVTVTGISPLLQTDKADIHTELKNTEITNLPLSNYRNYQKLLDLVPGATPARFQNAVTDTPARALTTNVNGTARNNNNTRQDGTANVYIWLPHHSVYVAPAETIESVNITTNSFDAEQGMAGGAAINVITKSGTNQFRGSAFVNHNNSRFQGRNLFLPADQDVPKGHRNIDGGTLGGPIARNHLFFFGSFEGMYESIAFIRNETVPSAALRNGDFNGTGTIIYDPLTGNPDGTGRIPFANNQIPANRISGVARQMLALVPAPNQPGTTNNYFAAGTQRLNRPNEDFKLNWNRSSAHQIWGKYGRMDASAPCDFALGAAGGDALCDGGPGKGDTTVQIGTIGHTYTLGNKMLMDGTFGFTRMDQTVTGPDFGQNFGLDVLKIPGTNGPDPRQGGMPWFDISGFTALGNQYNWEPIYRNDRSYTATTNVTWLQSQHDMRFGFDLVKHELNHWQPEIGAGPRGRFIFRGGVTALNGGAASNDYNAFASFLLGLPQEVQKSYQYELMTGREWQYAFYFRDRWQASDKLTVSYGVRFERYPLMHRATRGIEQIDWPTAINGQGLFVKLGGLGGNANDLGIKMKYPWAVPRVGVAYRINEENVVRAGYGMTIDPIPFSRPLRGFYPLTIAQSFPGANPFAQFAPIESGIPGLVGPDLSTGRIPLDPAADMRSIGPTNEMNRGYIHSWNAMYERRLPGNFVGSVGYVGTATVNQIADLDLNASAPGLGQAGRTFYKYGNRVGLTSYWDGWLDAHYNSLQVSLNRPFSNGLLVKGAYTLSRAINETDDTGWAGVTFNRPSADLTLNNLDAWRDAAKAMNKALAGYDRTHNLQLAVIAELPFGRGGQGGALNPIIKDWQVNGIVSVYSGTPFTVRSPGDTLNAPGNTFGGNTNTADLVGTPNRTGNTQLDPDRGTVTMPFFDASAWKAVTDVRFGNTGRNSVRGPGAHTVDFSIFRNFPFGTRSKLEARWEMFNLFNSPVFNNPEGLVTSRNFMRITGTANGLVFDRQMQFGLRFSF